jgi:hypothetical protein
VAAGASLADVYLRIHITEADIRKAAKQAGDEAGREAAKGFQATLNRELRNVKLAAIKIRAELDVDALNKELAKVKADPIKIGVDIDLAAMAKEMDELSARMREKGRETGEETGDKIADSLSARLKRLDLEPINLKADASEALAEIDRVQDQLRQMRETATTAEVSLDVTKALAELDRLKKQLNPGLPDEAEQAADRAKTAIERRLEALHITPPNLDLDVSGALNDIDRVRQELRDLAESDASVAVKLDAAAALRELDRVERQIRDLDGRTAVVNVRADVDSQTLVRAATAFQGVTTAAGLAGVAISALAAASSGGIAAIGGIAAAIAAVGLASTAAIPAVIGLAGATAAIGGALSGPLEAFKAYQQQASAAGTASTDLSGKQKALAGAQQALADAETAGARQIQAAQEALAEARVAASERVESAQESLKAAQDRAEEADKRYAETVRDLAAAYEEAQRALEDLNESASDRARDVEGVEISLARARERQAKVNKDAKATDLDRRDAAYDVKVAEDRLSDAIRARDRSTQDADKANKLGVAGMPQVVAANDRIAAAQKARADAAAGVTKAEQNLAKAQADGAKLVIKAQQNLARAQDDAAKSTARAKDGVAAAAAALTAGSKSADKYADAMAKLSPEGRKFVLALIDVNNALAEQRKKLEAAVLPGFTSFLQSAQTQADFLGDKLSVLGATIGNVAAKVGEFVASDVFTDRLGTMLDGVNRAAETLSTAVVPLIRAVMDIGAAATPLLERFATWVTDVALRFSKWIEAKNTTGELQEAIKKAGDTLANWGAAAWNVISGVYNIIRDANTGMGDFSEGAKDATAKFKEWTEVNTDKIKGFFETLRGVDWGAIAAGSAALLGLAGAMRAVGSINTIGTALAPLLAAGPVGWATIAVGLLAAGLGVLVASNSELRKEIAEKFGPILKDFAKWWKEEINPFIKKAGEELVPHLKKAIDDLGDAMQNMLGDKSNRESYKTLASTLPIIADAIGLIARGVALVVKWGGGPALPGVLLAIRGIGEAIWNLGKYFSWDYWRDEVIDNELPDKFWGWVKDEIWQPVVDGSIKWWDEQGKKVFKAIGDFFSGIVDWVKDLLGIKSPSKVFEEIGQDVVDGLINGLSALPDKAKELFTRAMNMAKDAWLAGFDMLKERAEAFYNETVKPVWDNVTSYISDKVGAAKDKLSEFGSWLTTGFREFWTSLRDDVSEKWTAIQNFTTTKADAIKEKLSQFGSWLTAGFREFWKSLQDDISAKWTAIQSFVSDKVDAVRAKLSEFGSWLTTGFRESWKSLQDDISAKMTAIQDKLASGWDAIRNNIFTPFANFITKDIPNAFAAGVTAVGKNWDKIVEIVKTPIRTVVSAVINGGIIDGINWIIGKVGGVPLKYFNAPGLAASGASFATGGVLPGYTPGRDVHRFVSSTAGALELSGGEAVMRPEWTQAVGRDAVNAMNAMARTGGADAVQGFLSRLGGDAGSPLSPATIDRVLQGHSRWTRAPRLGGFADGGVIDALSGPWNSIKKLWKAGTDPAGLFKDAVDKILGKVPGLGTVKEIGVNSSRKIIDSVVTWIKEKVKAFIEVLVPGGGNIGNVPIPAELEGRVKAAQDFLHQMKGQPYQMAAFGPSATDCSGMVSAVYNIMRGVQPWAGVRFTTHNEADYMTEKGAGVLTAGWINGGVDVAHTAGNIGGLAFEQTPPGLRVGNVYATVGSFPNIGHPKGMAGGGVWDYIERMRGTTMVPLEALMQMPRPGAGGGGRHWPWGAPLSPGLWPWAGGPRKGGFANGGVFDNGGLLKPGQVGINMGGKPEAVLSPKDTDNYRKLAGTDLVGVMREVRDAVREVPAGVGGHLNRSARTVNLRGKAL